MEGLFGGARFVCGGSVRGRLFDLGEYPGLRVDGAGASVVGEVYEIDDEILMKLDEVEAESDYQRRRVEITVGDGAAECWVYEPSAEVYQGRELIKSGDWIEYAKTRRGPSRGRSRGG